MNKTQSDSNTSGEASPGFGNPNLPGSSTLSFQEELQVLINKHSIENLSNTPDFILAKYLAGCLDSFNIAVNARSTWYGPGGDARFN